MATQLQIRRGTTAQMGAFTGAEGELAVNTSTDTVHVHDGATAGGFALAKADGSNIGTYAGSFTTLAASGAVTLSSTLAVTGTATMGGLTLDGNNSYTSNIKFDYGASAPTYFSNWGYKSSSDGNKVFLTITDGGAAKDVLVANYNGNVGIGSTLPDSLLHVSGVANLRIAYNGTSANYMDADTNIFRSGNGLERMRIAGGSVLIGKTTPTDLHNTWNHLIIGEKGAIISENGAGGIDGITLADNVYVDADTGGYAYQTTAAASMIRQTAGITQFANAASGSAGAALTPDETMRIDASGNLLVGQSSTTLPGVGNTTAGVSIRGHDGSFFSRALGSGDANNVVSVNRSTADGNILGFQRDGTAKGSIGTTTSAGGSRFAIGGAGDTGIIFAGTGVFPAMGITASDNTIDLGSANYRYKDLYLSGVANVGSILQTGSTSSLVASFENTNTYGYGMRITTYSSGVEYALAVDSYGGGYSRDFVIGVDGYIYSLPTYGLTTGGSANMFVATDGSFQRSTSSLRYKHTVNDATHGLTELLTLRPVTYKGNNDGDTVFGGLIAEEVHDAGLTEFVQYNDEDEPDALAYGNMVSLCIKAIQELKEELNTATARITELENNS